MTVPGRPAAFGRHAVFLHEFVDVACPFPSLEPHFCSGGAWLAPLAARASDDGETIFVRLRRDSGARWVGVEIRIRLGRCSRHGDGAIVPIRWEASHLVPLFPVLDGNLGLTPLGLNESRISLQGAYRPPLDGVGQVLDRALLHPVAESTVRSFLRQVARTLETTTAVADRDR